MKPVCRSAAMTADGGIAPLPLTVGARVNRLELQQSRLESIQETFTSLLSKTEDANMAEVIMQLQLQENVYRASLAAGARIIQPSLLDFLR